MLKSYLGNVNDDDVVYFRHHTNKKQQSECKFIWQGKKQNSRYHRTIPVLIQNVHDGQKKKGNWLKPGLIFVHPMYNKYKDKYKYAFVLAYFHWFYSEFNGETTCSLLFLLIADVVTNQIIMQQVFLGLTLKCRYATWRWTRIWLGTAQYQQGSPSDQYGLTSSWLSWYRFSP